MPKGLKRSRSQDSAGYRSDQELVPRTLLHTLEILFSVRQFCQEVRPKILHDGDKNLDVFWNYIDLSVGVLEAQKPLIDMSRKQARLLTDILEIWEQVFDSSISSWSPKAQSGDLAFPKLTALRRFLKEGHTRVLPDPANLRSAFRVFDEDVRLMLTKQIRDWFRLLGEIVNDVSRNYEISGVPKRHLRENSKTAWEVTEDIFQALDQLKCTDQHAHDIYLLLATYPTCEKPVDNAYAYVDVLISVGPSGTQWEEVRIHTFKLRSEDIEPALNRDPDWFNDNAREVRSLCETLSRSASSFRRNWVRERGLKLYDHNSSALQIPSSYSHSLISFKDLINAYATTLPSSKFLVWRISIPAKLNLAILLSHTLLHLCVIDHLRQDWPAQHIFFLRHGDTTLLRPLLRMSADLRRFEPSAAEDEYHRFPMLIGFATMLLELHECQTLRSMVPEVSLSADIRDDIRRLHTAFNSRLSNIGNKSLRQVIQFCLNPAFKRDKSGNIDHLQVQVYERIVKPLELALEDIDGAKNPLDNIDDNTSRMNIETGIDISKHSWSVRQPDVRPASTDHRVSEEEYISSSLPTLKDPTMESIVPQQINMSDTTSNVFKSTSTIELTPSQMETDEWFDTLDDIFERYFISHTNSVQPSIEVAILDTGIDQSHASILGYQSRIARVCSFIDGDDGSYEDDRSGDSCGHGTHIASSVLKWAPFANVSIARVTRTTNARALSEDDSFSIASALRAAREKWAADVIIMPFGFDRFQAEIDIELDKIIRHERNILVFAAASNDGPNNDRAYPANKDQVFCIYSTDGSGLWSRWNSSEQAREHNFAIIGEEIESAWPAFSTSSITRRERKSGTSYAAAMAGALAASFLHWSMSRAWYNTTPIKVKSFNGMKRIFTLMAKKHKKYFSIFPQQLFRGDEEIIDSRIIDKLTPQKT